MLNLKCDQPHLMQIPSVFPTFLNCGVSFYMHYFSQFTQRLTTVILNVALGWTFQFSHDEKDKKLKFSRLRPVW